MWTVAFKTKYIHAQGAGWYEPEIGHFVYGEPRDMPPLFKTYQEAKSWALKNNKGGFKIVKLEVM